jgi:ribonucleoside-triphosphate reductase (formate)
MDISRKSLVIKRKFIEKYIELGLYPYSKFYLADIKRDLKNITETILIR